MTEEKTIEKVVENGFTLIHCPKFSQESPLMKVVIICGNYSSSVGTLYKRVEISGLDRVNPTIDYKLGGLEEVLPYINSGERKVAEVMERAEVRREILGEKVKSFQDRLYLLGNTVLSLHGNIPQSIKDKYGVN